MELKHLVDALIYNAIPIREDDCFMPDRDFERRVFVS